MFLALTVTSSVLSSRADLIALDLLVKKFVFVKLSGMQEGEVSQTEKSFLHCDREVKLWPGIANYLSVVQTIYGKAFSCLTLFFKTGSPTKIFLKNDTVKKHPGNV